LQMANRMGADMYYISRRSGPIVGCAPRNGFCHETASL
jgi:hypothetical protein